MSRGSWLLLGLTACGGIEANEFVLSYTEQYCALRLECGDPSDLVFEGDGSVEACQAAYGPGFEARGQGCSLKSRLAEQCLDELDAVACPADGDVDSVLPAVCSTVWVKCEAVQGGSTDDTAAAGTGERVVP